MTVVKHKIDIVNSAQGDEGPYLRRN